MSVKIIKYYINNGLNLTVCSKLVYIVCIAQTTLVMVNNALLVNGRRFLFFRFDLMSDL